MTQKTILPELLAPAGTREALDAAIHAGADAVYFGGSRFNARMAADNFAGDAMEDAIRACAFYGVKSNITINTLPYEREQAELLRFGEQLCKLGADAVICADLGTAALLHRYLPELPLHASTQCAGHNTDAARFLAGIGFTRMVAARELSYAALAELCKGSPIETELFIHGAMCVSQSGGCLFSSLVGGRSGNRGACAQPCRLPYHCTTREPAQNGGLREEYPLSLRDMCLASHIPELLSLGAASFKIEGRMKSPAYVGGVVSIYRRLLDEGRNADESELAALAALFSRDGFTDGYFRGKTGHFMQGVRSAQDKTATQKAERAVQSGRQDVRRIPADMQLTAHIDAPLTLTMRTDRASVTVTGALVQKALDHPAERDAVIGNLSRLGQTPFFADNIEIACDKDALCPPSALNALRRAAAEQLEQALRSAPPHPERKTCALPKHIPELSDAQPGFAGTYACAHQASFLYADRIPEDAHRFYEILYLPAAEFARDPALAISRGVNGIILPPVMFDGERNAVAQLLEKASAAGIRHALVANVGHIALARESGFVLHGDLRCNLYTGLSAEIWAEAGFSDLLLSPELTAPQIRDIGISVPKGAVTYGRVPLMTLQRCIIREAAHIPDGKPCRHCDDHPAAYLTDRKRAVFPVTRVFPHRNIVWNSAPLYMADKPEVLASMRLQFTHHIFTIETKDQSKRIMEAYFAPGSKKPEPPAAFRRIQS